MSTLDPRGLWWILEVDVSVSAILLCGSPRCSRGEKSIVSEKIQIVIAVIVTGIVTTKYIQISLEVDHSPFCNPKNCMPKNPCRTVNTTYSQRIKGLILTYCDESAGKKKKSQNRDSICERLAIFAGLL
jgi:hypothetical protein